MWLFVCVQVKRGDRESEARLFSVPDFIGFACREVGESLFQSLNIRSSSFANNIHLCVLCVCAFFYSASKIRGSVAGIPFERFHKYSSEIIRAGVFGNDEHGKLKDRLMFPANNLVSYCASPFTIIKGLYPPIVAGCK